MTSSTQNSPSLLQRVRILPKEVQRKLRGQTTNDSSKTSETVIIKDPKKDSNCNPISSTTYNCR